MQNQALREYVARRGWTIAFQVREVNSGAASRAISEIITHLAFYSGPASARQGRSGDH
jgi:hypothetical protein